MQQTNSEKLLTSTGVIAFSTAVWHLLCIWGGPSWYTFASAPHALIELAQQGTYLRLLPPLYLLGLCLSVVPMGFQMRALYEKCL